MGQPRGGRAAGPDTEHTGAAPTTAAASLSLVRRVAEQLAAAESLSDIAMVVVSQVREALGASAVSVNILEPDGRSLVSLLADGYAEETHEKLRRRIPVQRTALVARALSECRPIVYSSVAERDAMFPDYAGIEPATEAAAVIPLAVRGRPIGMLTFGWARSRPFGDDDVALLQVVAHQCAVAIDRAMIEQVRRAERDTLELLSEGTRLMVSALVPSEVVDRLVHLAVPRLAPWCAVYVAEGAVVRRVAVEAYGYPTLAKGLRGELVRAADSAGVITKVLASGEAVVVPVVDTNAVIPLYRGEHITRVLQSEETWTGLVVPVKASGDTIGAVSMASPRWGGKPPDEVRFAAEGLAARAGVALVNARRFEQERSTTLQLVSAVLPASIPAIPGFEVGARYLPAGAGVAGDWYDVMALPDGKWLLGIGDAGGHGIPAASLMAQLRNAARGLAIGDASPSAILQGLHLLTDLDGADSFATASYAVVDTSGATLRWAARGHVPPLVYGPHRSRYLDDAVGPPLGAPTVEPTPEHVIRWRPGQGVVLVTDGVVERRGRGLAEGMAALQAAVRESVAEPADDLAQLIVDRVCAGAEDDCCVIVVRRS